MCVCVEKSKGGIYHWIWRTQAVPFLIKELYKSAREHTSTHTHTDPKNTHPWQQLWRINSLKLRATHHTLQEHTPLSVIYKQTHAPSYYSRGSVHTRTCPSESSRVNHGVKGAVHPKRKTTSHSVQIVTMAIAKFKI